MGPGTVGLASRDTRSSSLLPQSFVEPALAVLDGIACRLVSIGVTANGITLASLTAAAAAAVLVGSGRIGWAAPLVTVASLGDALDGMVARRSGSASIGGGLLDASVDRYEEALILGGVAVLFRASTLALVATIAALAGSFMVSYGSAKAEALHRVVPAGVLRRAERAMLLVAGVVVTPPFASLARARGYSWWSGHAPLLAVVVVIAIVGNLSAVLRLRRLAAR